MGFRFYRRIKIAPGVSINLGKKGASVSVGPRGAKMTFGPHGIRAGLGVPGTGMRYEKRIGGGENMKRESGGSGLSWAILIVCTVVGIAALNKHATDPGGIWLLFAFFAFAVVGILLVALIVSACGSSADAGGYAQTSSPRVGTRKTTDMASACRALYSFLKEVDRNPRSRKELSDTPGLERVGTGGNHFTLSQKLAFIVFCDLRDIYVRLGHNIRSLHNQEGVGYAMIVLLLISNEFDPSWFNNSAKAKSLLKIVEDLSKTNVGHITIQDHEDELRFALIFGKIHHEEDWVNRYASLVYKWASLVAKANDSISPRESAVLKAIVDVCSVGVPSGNVKISGTQSSSSFPTPEPVPFEKRDARGRKETTEEDCFEALNALIGLVPVKKEVRQLASFIKIQRKRERSGMRTAPVSYHCVFTGNPGTGKTTVARILAQIYRDLGVVKKGHLVETDRSGLIGEYVGHTAIKTNKMIDAALDGVLFIDEAYSLVHGGENDYGREAIATLLKRMEDDRKRLVVILAGYTDEMKKFIDTNPGLQSRFNRYVEFPDYNADELAKIFLRRTEECQYSCNADVRASIVDIMTRAVQTKDKNFGNGRFVRNLFEKAIQRQAVRLSSVSPLTKEMLSELTLHDLGYAYEE